MLISLEHNRSALHKLFSKQYGIGVERKESTKIDENGCAKVNTNLIYNATAENIRVVELFAEGFSEQGPIKYKNLISPLVQPTEYQPCKFAPSVHARGWHTLEFVKPLRPGENVMVSYHSSWPSGTFAINSLKYPPGHHFESVTYVPRTPTSLSVLEVEFDDGYSVDLSSNTPKAVVCYGDALVEHIQETERVRQLLRLDGRRVLLQVPYPLTGLQYAIRWTLTK